MLFGYIKRAVSKFFKKDSKGTALLNNGKPSAEGLRGFIENWNVEYPIDRWWREKHKVAFGSEEHDSMSLVNMYLEYQEDIIYEEIHDRQDYEPNKGRFIKEHGKGIELTEEEKYQNFMKESAEIDLSVFDD